MWRRCPGSRSLVGQDHHRIRDDGPGIARAAADHRTARWACADPAAQATFSVPRWPCGGDGLRRRRPSHSTLRIALVRGIRLKRLEHEPDLAVADLGQLVVLRSRRQRRPAGRCRRWGRPGSRGCSSSCSAGPDGPMIATRRQPRWSADAVQARQLDVAHRRSSSRSRARSSAPGVRSVAHRKPRHVVSCARPPSAW